MSVISIQLRGKPPQYWSRIYKHVINKQLVKCYLTKQNQSFIYTVCIIFCQYYNLFRTYLHFLHLIYVKG